MGRRRECRERREPFYSQENQYSARYGPEGFRQCRCYRAIYDPGEDGRIWRQEKKYCMSLGRNFENGEHNS